MHYFLYIIFGVLPSVVWLLFYLRKDAHPESNRMILKIFFYGMLASIPAFLIEMGFSSIFKQLTPYNPNNIETPFLVLLLYWVLGVALVEEGLKFLVVKEKVLSSPEMDEPLDAMLYMIIAALGFAALENILFLAALGAPFQFSKIITLSALRFVGATFLHALASGLVGYFLALSLLKTERKLRLISLGLGIAAALHGLYNFSIIKIESDFKFAIIPVAILIALALFVTFGFKSLQKIKSICNTAIK